MSEHPIIQRTRARRGPSINAFGRVACEPPRLLGEGATVKRCQVDIVGRTLTSRREGHTRTPKGVVDEDRKQSARTTVTTLIPQVRTGDPASHILEILRIGGDLTVHSRTWW